MLTNKTKRYKSLPEKQQHHTSLEDNYHTCLLWSALQASEGVPIRFFSMLPELVEAYYSPNMGLITHLQYPVLREDEMDEEPGQTTSLHLNSVQCNVAVLKQPHTPHLCPAESNNLPPQLPPRNFLANDGKDGEPKSSEQSCKSLSDTYLMRLQHMDMSMYGHICRISTYAPQPENTLCKASDNTLAAYSMYNLLNAPIMSSGSASCDWAGVWIECCREDICL